MKRMNFSVKQNNKLYLQFEYDVEFLEEFKKTFKSIHFNKRSSSWDMNTSVHNIKAVSDNLAYIDFIDEDSKANLELIKLKFHENLTLQNPAIDLSSLNVPLRKFQEQAVWYLIANNGGYEADDMGLGKSLVSMSFVEYMDLHPCIIFCPKSLKFNWEQEINKWFPNKIIKILGPKSRLSPTDQYDYLIINYDLVSKFKVQLNKCILKCAIMDEAQFIKSKEAKRTRDITELCSRIPAKVALSGTPMPNRPLELISQLQCIDKLRFIYTPKEFIDRYCNPQETLWGLDTSGSSNLEELNERLKQTCMIRRTVEQVAQELPDKQRVTIPFEIDNRVEYTRANDEFLEWLKDVTKEALLEEGTSEFMAEQQAIRKVIKARYAEFLVKIEKLKQLAVQGKFEQFCEWLDIFIESGKKIVVFIIHKDTQQKLYDKYKDNALHIFAEDSAENRIRTIEKFKVSKEQVLVASLKCTSIGLNLQFLQNFAFLELDWVPSTHEQAEARGHRIGQTDVVNCYYFLAKDTVDDKIWRMIQDKTNIIEQIMKPN